MHITCRVEHWNQPQQSVVQQRPLSVAAHGFYYFARGMYGADYDICGLKGTARCRAEEAHGIHIGLTLRYTVNYASSQLEWYNQH